MGKRFVRPSRLERLAERIQFRLTEAQKEEESDPKGNSNQGNESAKDFVIRMRRESQNSKPPEHWREAQEELYFG